MSDHLLLFDLDGTATRPARRQSGVATGDVVLSAHIADNAAVFPAVLGLHVPKGSIIADITYGTGVFWRDVRRTDYTLLPTDLKLGQSWERLPHEDGSVDAVVFDPPYMEGLYRKTTSQVHGRDGRVRHARRVSRLLFGRLRPDRRT